MVFKVNLLVDGIVVELLVLYSVLEWLHVIRLVEDIRHAHCHLDVLARELAIHNGDSDPALNGLDYLQHALLVNGQTNILRELLGLTRR